MFDAAHVYYTRQPLSVPEISIFDNGSAAATCISSVLRFSLHPSTCSFGYIRWWCWCCWCCCCRSCCFSLFSCIFFSLSLLQFCWRDNSWTRTSFCVCIVSSRVSSNNNSKPKMKQTKKLHNNFGHIFMRIALFATQHTEVAHIHSIQRHRQIHRLRLFYAEFSFLMSKRRRYNESRRTNLSWFLPFHFYYYVLQLYFRHLRSFFFPFVLRAFSLVFLLYDTRRKDSEWMRTDWVGEMLLVRCLQFLNSVNVTWQRRHSDMALANQQTLQNCSPIGIW